MIDSPLARCQRELALWQADCRQLRRQISDMRDACGDGFKKRDMEIERLKGVDPVMIASLVETIEAEVERRVAEALERQRIAHQIHVNRIHETRL